MKIHSICIAFLIVMSGFDAQAQWVQANGPYGAYIQSFAVSGPYVLAGTDSGAFFSTNSGTSWTAMNSVLSNTSVSALAFSEGHVFAGTSGSGVWRRPLSKMITSVGRYSSDSRGTLLSNYK